MTIEWVAYKGQNLSALADFELISYKSGHLFNIRKNT